MNTCEIATNERDLKIVYGMFNLAEKPRELALASVKYLYSDLTDIRRYYIRLGFHLEEFSEMHGYEDFGYLTLEDFCQANLGLDKSAVSRCINVYREFNAGGIRTFGNGIETRGCSMELAEEWQDYSYTQLCEMLPLTPEERRKVTPDMTIKQIREFKKSLKDGKSMFQTLDDVISVIQQEKSVDGSVASTQQEDSAGGSVALTQPKIFSYDEYLKKSGIVEQNYIKTCESLGSVSVYVFDNRGRKILCNYWGEILERPQEKNNNCLVIRMNSSFDPAVAIIDQQD
ncbi:MAG: hypothetical protein K2J67_05925 [Lachnospiraceae bacterium]|nr:hypothetical protein [Lachnospiraceae bacterium]